LRSFDELRQWDSATLFATCESLATGLELKVRDFLAPIFVAIGGKAVTLPLFDSMALLGADVTRMRLRSALASLGGVSKKEAKRFEKSWQQISRG